MVGLKQAKRYDPQCRNKVEFVERQFEWRKAFVCPQKGTSHSIELSLSTCVLYRRIFNLEMQNFSLENHHLMCSPARHFLMHDIY